MWSAGGIQHGEILIDHVPKLARPAAAATVDPVPEVLWVLIDCSDKDPGTRWCPALAFLARALPGSSAGAQAATARLNTATI